MTKRILLLTISVIMVLTFGLAMAGCGSSKEEAASNENSDAPASQDTVDIILEENENAEDGENAWLEEPPEVVANDYDQVQADKAAFDKLKKGEKVVPYDKYIGTWSAESENAEYYFGEYEITFNKDMTYDAYITEDRAHDKVDYNKETGHVHLTGYFEDYFKFNSKGKLILCCDGVNFVMTKH